MSALMKAQSKVDKQYYAIREAITLGAIQDVKNENIPLTDKEKLTTVCKRALKDFERQMEAVKHQYAPNSQESRFAEIYYNEARHYCLISKNLPQKIKEALSSS